MKVSKHNRPFKFIYLHPKVKAFLKKELKGKDKKKITFIFYLHNSKENAILKSQNSISKLNSYFYILNKRVKILSNFYLQLFLVHIVLVII